MSTINIIWGLTHFFMRSQRLNVFVTVTVGESLHVDVTQMQIYFIKTFDAVNS